MPNVADIISLNKFGWTGKFIPTDLNQIHANLPTWRDLHILRPDQSSAYRFPWTCFQTDMHEKFIPGIKIGDKIDSGSYGNICLAKRAIFKPVSSQNSITHFIKQAPSKEIIAKILPIELSESEKCASKTIQEIAYQDEIQAILYEATLHIIVNHVFQTCGIPSAVPTFHEVVGFSEKQTPSSAMDISGVVLTMEFVEGWTLFDFLKKYFCQNHTKEENELFLIDILIQLAVYLDLLQTQLQFNHRDLKINNILLRKTNTISAITHELLSQPWTCKNNVVIIDFGFSCIACDGPSRRSILQAGSWFSDRHDCMKKGRDIALFLYSLQTYYPLESHISNELFQLLEQSLVATQVAEGGSSVRLLNGVNEKGIPYTHPHRLDFTNGIYKFLRFSDVEIPGCEPQTFMQILEMYANKKYVTANPKN